MALHRFSFGPRNQFSCSACVASMIAFTLIAACGRSVGAEDSEATEWSSFQNGGAVSFDKEAVVTLGEVNWEKQLDGYGQSSPVVWEDQIYLTTVRGTNKEQCLVSAISLVSGESLWQHTTENASPQESSNYVSRAAPSAAVDAAGVVCFFEGGNVIALTHNGDVRWERNLVDDFGELPARHGLASSVEQTDDAVFIWVERSEDPYVVCLAKSDGEIRWKTKGLGATSWSSPRLIPAESGHHLVISGIGSIVGLSPVSGEVLWRLEDVNGNSTPTPMPLGEGRFLVGATVGRGESGGGRAAESNGVIQISQDSSGKWTAEYVWRARRATSSFGSPIVHNGMALFVNREGVLYGVDATSGKEVFAKRLKGSMWATPIGLGPQVFFFERDGKVDRVTDLAGRQTVSTWDGLPEPVRDAEPSASGGAAASGSVVYAAVWTGQQVLIRRGDRLYSISTKVDNSK